ncbi:MAG: methyltransferase [Bacteroidota bacterium]|nr:methyltransferase [Bacteroidota bacterium]
MKVCTDACLFGAWVAEIIVNAQLPVKRILDIGSGTGLLSLMLAQKSTASIDAIEIDEAAAEQAQENFKQSKYKSRLHLIHTDIRTYNVDEVYDLVISNPPFFDNHLKSEHKQRNIALHSQLLNYTELISAAKAALKPGGVFAILLPFSRSAAFIAMAATHNLLLNQHLALQQTERHPPFRSIMLFSLQHRKTVNSTLTIKEEGEYTLNFTTLLKDYYLFL